MNETTLSRAILHFQLSILNSAAGRLGLDPRDLLDGLASLVLLSGWSGVWGRREILESDHLFSKVYGVPPTTSVFG